MDNDKKKQNSASDNENNENKIAVTSGKEIKKHLWMFLLVAFGVLLFLCVNHLEAIFRFIVSVFVVLSPLFTGALIALILNTPMKALEQFLTWLSKKIFGKKRDDYSPNKRLIEIISLVLTVLLSLLLIYIIAYAVIPQLIKSITSIKNQVQDYIPHVLALLDRIEKYGIKTDSLKEWVESVNMGEIMSKLTDNGGIFIDNAGSIIDTVISGASSLISGTVSALTSIIFALYILANKKTLSSQMKRLSYAYFKKSKVDRAIGFCKMGTETFSNFISGQCLDAVILGLMMFIAMTVFGFPYALAISALITVTAIIPYVGAFLGGVFGVLLMIMDSPLQALLYVVLFIVVQQIDNHLVYPRVVGSSVGLPPIWTFAAVIVGGSLFGIAGMVLFIPLFSVIYTLIKSNVSKRLDSRGITVPDPDYTTERTEKKKNGFFSKLPGLIKTKKNPDKPSRDEDKSREENDHSSAEE